MSDRDEIVRKAVHVACQGQTAVGWPGVAERAAREALRLRDEREGEAVAAERKSKDRVYNERDRVVALLASIYPSSLERHPDDDTTWEDDWRWIVYLDTPAGQLSWHIHDSELPLFAHVERFRGWKWTEEKYERLAFLSRPEPAPVRYCPSCGSERGTDLSDDGMDCLCGWRAEPAPEPGECCDCGYAGEDESPCPKREDGIHCEHWWDGSEEPVPEPKEPAALRSRDTEVDR